MADRAPLEDPTYDPTHKPVDGRVPEVVAKWGPASQLRWFDRFFQELQPATDSYWERFYCTSIEHIGQCCISCIQDQEQGYGSADEHCCCVGSREAYAT